MMLDLGNYEENAVLIASELFLGQIKEWNKAVGQQMKGFFDQLSLPPVTPSFQKLVEKAMTLSYLAGMDRVKEAIDKSKARRKGLEYAEPGEDLLTTFDEAVRTLRNKGVISPGLFKEASASIKAASFSVQRIERMNAIIHLKGTLMAAIEHGLTFADWTDTLPEIWTTHGITPLSPHHLETVFRTNMGSAYEIANEEATRGNPFVWGYEYSGIPDGRESDICRPFFGVIREKDDLFWMTASPLNHYRCRCTKIPVTQYDVEDLGIKATASPKTENVPEDFRQNARTMDGYRRKLDGFVRQKERDVVVMTQKLLDFKKNL